jgi:hypothetical protein
VHIATKGPIGPACRQFCRKEELKFTTSFTTRFDEYVQLRFGVPSRFTFRMLRWFHSAASNVMIASKPFKKELEEKGFANTVLWPRAWIPICLTWVTNPSSGGFERQIESFVL